MDWGSFGFSVDSRMISAANWFGFLGSGLLERLMDSLWPGFALYNHLNSKQSYNQNEPLPKQARMGHFPKIRLTRRYRVPGMATSRKHLPTNACGVQRH